MAEPERLWSSVPVAATIAAVCYIGARLLAVSTVNRVVNNDTPGYVDIDLFGGAQRPWVLPVIRAVFDNGSLVVVHAVVSAVAFMVLAVAIAARLATTAARVLALAGVPLLGMTQRVTTWDAVISTESLAVSFTALGIAAALWWRTLPSWTLVGLFIAWTFLRDAHLLMALPLAVVAAWFTYRADRRVLACWLVAVAIWGFLAAQNDRWVESYNVTSNIAWRPDDLEWFLANGMPDIDALDEEDSLARFRGMQADERFQEWAENDGMAVYVRYLVAHPGVLMRAVPAIVSDFDIAPESMVDQTLVVYAETPAVPFNVLWPREGSVFTIQLAALAGAAAVWLRRTPKRSDVVMPATLLASTIPHALLVYHGAPMELARHSVVLAFVAVISSVLLLLYAFDQMVMPHLSARYASTRSMSPLLSADA